MCKHKSGRLFGRHIFHTVYCKADRSIQQFLFNFPHKKSFIPNLV